MNRTTLSLIAAVVALVAVTGFATLAAPDHSGAPAAPAAAALLPVERTTVVCPSPSMSEVADTSITSFTPKGTADESAGGSAELKETAAVPSDGSPSGGGGKSKGGKAKDGKAKTPAGGAKGSTAGKSLITVKEPGKPVSDDVSGSGTPALLGVATGSLAPGWTTQETTTLSVGDARGLLGTTCTPPDTDFWFPGASTQASRQDYVHLTNPDDSAAVVNIDLYGKDGTLKSDAGDGIPVPGRSSVPVLLSTLTKESVQDVTVHVTTRSGRVGAVIAAADAKAGSDWLAASTDPADRLVLPGIPADATDVRLIAFSPGQNDANLKIQLSSPDGTIIPAGNASLQVKSGMTAAVDLQNLTRGQAGSLVLSQSSDPAPVVAALRVVRGKGTKQEIAFIPATGPIESRATVPDNRAKGTTLSLAAPSGTAQVKVTASAGSGGGEPVEKTYTVKGGTTQAFTPPVPQGLKGPYALTVEKQSGGPVYASRMLALPEDGVQMFTVQTLPDDRGLVAVPRAKEDLSILGR